MFVTVPKKVVPLADEETDDELRFNVPAKILLVAARLKLAALRLFMPILMVPPTALKTKLLRCDRSSQEPESALELPLIPTFNDPSTFRVPAPKKPTEFDTVLTADEVLPMVKLVTDRIPPEGICVPNQLLAWASGVFQK